MVIYVFPSLFALQINNTFESAMEIVLGQNVAQEEMQFTIRSTGVYANSSDARMPDDKELMLDPFERLCAHLRAGQDVGISFVAETGAQDRTDDKEIMEEAQDGVCRKGGATWSSGPLVISCSY